MIVDEAKSVDEEIFQGIDRCDYSVLAYISSPDEKTGRFYEAFQSDQFKHFHAGLKDCKHIGKERIEAIKAWYGPNSPYTGSVLEGDFMDYGAGVPHIIEHGELEAWRNKTIGVLHGRNLVIACDWARGGDDNVILVRDGNAIIDIRTCREKDTAKAVDWAATMIRDLGYDSKNMMIIGDASGVGGPINDQLRRRGINVNDFNFGGKSTDPRFDYEGSHRWHLVAQMIRDGKIVPPPYHQQDVKRLFEQLANRQVKVGENGKLGIESKKEMQARGVSSPDIADAMVMGFGQPDALAHSYLPYDDSGRREISRQHGWAYTSDSDDESYKDRRTWNNPGRGDDNWPSEGFGGVHGGW